MGWTLQKQLDRDKMMVGHLSGLHFELLAIEEGEGDAAGQGGYW